MNNGIESKAASTSSSVLLGLGTGPMNALDILTSFVLCSVNAKLNV